ncbi:kelch-like protein 17 [Plakobranchus ocellatus]|uniref:Kelch-like protein 17 n=1 Tax=Plakobranchus ocellatus TaxID=259542 RepID=A0AAV4DKV4_9GAST|nr:kelch-like protein 17 [Plakobranchus ocellatus]
MIESQVFHIQAQANSALSVMQELRCSQQLCDIVLCVGGAKFSAHRIVLAGCSPYLRAMFTNGMLESEREFVELHGIDPGTMGLLLDFMYTCRIEVSVDNVQAVLQGASMLGLHSLRNLCAHFLQNQLTASNCLGIHYFADIYSCHELESVARQFIYQNFLDVIRMEEFFELPEERLLCLLKSDKLQVMSENQVFEAACSWLQYDPGKRMDRACNILQNIRLALLESSYLENVVLKSEYFRTCPKCQLLIAKAIRTKQDSLELDGVQPRSQPPCIYVMGGRNSTDSQLRSTERYDFLLDQWIHMPPMEIARTAVGAASLEGLLYVVGGECALADTQDDTLYLTSLEMYHPARKCWERKPSMKLARSFTAVAAVAGQLFAIGGEDRSGSYNIVECYNPNTETWSFVNCMKRRRAGAGVTVCDGKVYVAGGYDKGPQMDRASMEVYDPDTGDWTFAPEMEKACSGLSMVTLDHFIYAFGGRYRHIDQYFDHVERYNTITRQWTTIAPMTTPRAWFGIAVFYNRIYVCGGFDGNTRLRHCEMYNPESNSWRVISEMKIGRAGCGATVV